MRKELRIGNYVDLYGSVSQVQRADFSETEHGIAVDKGKPIPLTEEWLIKLGFRKSDEADHIYLFPGNDSLRLWGFSWTAQQFLFIDNWVDIPTPSIRSVHQLQNLYYALTGKELEL